MPRHGVPLRILTVEFAEVVLPPVDGRWGTDVGGSMYAAAWSLDDSLRENESSLQESPWLQ